MSKIAKASSFINIVAAALSVSLVGALLSFLADETQVDKALTQAAARVFAPVSALFNRGNSATSDRIVIVDIDAVSARRASEGWPFSYGHHARVLEQVRRQQPKALFVDIQFESDRRDPSLPRLLETLCRYKADGIPVFLAAGSESFGGTLRAELEGLQTVDKQPCFEKVSVGYEVSSDQVVWTYPLQPKNGAVEMRSAGLALAETLLNHPIQLSQQPSTMGLTWMAGGLDNGPLWVEEGYEESARPTHYCRASQLADLTLLPQIFRWGAYDKPYCPRHASLLVDWITAPRSEAQRQELVEALKDRVVLYGVSFDPNDHVTSPMHGRIPGVYLHAQAADNLIQHGDAWRRPYLAGDERSHYEEWGLKILVMFVLAFLVQSVLWLAQKVCISSGLGPVFSFLLAMAGLMFRSLRDERGSVLAQTWNAVFYLVEELLSFCGKLLQFWVGLLLACVLCMVMEWGFQISVVGYASLLFYVLAGEVFVSPTGHKTHH